jgi:hypothetical protein
VPNKVTREVRDAARKLVEDERYRAKLGERLESGKLAPAMETMLWHYAYGKPKETVDVEFPGGVPVDLIRHVIVDPKEGQ